MKSVPREPIYLTKFRKRQRENQPLPAPPADSIEYDLQIFQDSLNIPGESQLREKPTNTMINSVGSTTFVPEWYPNCTSLNATGPFRKSSLHETGLLASVHKTKASFKPNTARNRGKEEKENRPVIEVRLQPKLIEVPLSQKPPAQPLYHSLQQPTAAFQTLQPSPHHIHCPAPPSLMEKAYQLKISQLTQQHEQSQLIICDLTQRLEFHLSEKDKLAQRVSMMEKQLEELSADTELYGLVEKDMEDYGIQVGQEEPQVENYAAQTQEIVQVVRLSEEGGEDWFQRARQFKVELERERMVNFNRESEYRVLLENSQIDWRGKLQRTQRQLDHLQSKYDSKCQEVRDKDSLINKYLSKH